MSEGDRGQYQRRGSPPSDSRSRRNRWDDRESHYDFNEETYRRKTSRSRSRSRERDYERRRDHLNEDYDRDRNESRRRSSSSSENDSDSYKKRQYHRKHDEDEAGSSSVDVKFPPTDFKAPQSGIVKQLGGMNSGISIKLQTTPKPKPAIVAPTLKVSSVFGQDADDDDDNEEMPPECRMRMKNVGRETPTSAGPNSFGKTKKGFCNMAYITEKQIEDDMVKKSK